MQKQTELKVKIQSVKNIQTIAQTMAVVAAAKLSRTRRQAEGMRLYAEKIRRLLLTQQGYAEMLGVPLFKLSPLLKERESCKNLVLILLTGDLGMCGSYNLQANHLAFQFIKAREKEGKKVMLWAKGKKGQRYFSKLGYEFLAEDVWLRIGVTDTEVEDILSFVTRCFVEEQADEVYCLYSKFYTPVRREATIIRILPIKMELRERPEKEEEKWDYEPNFVELVQELIPLYLKAQVYDVLLESFASEQGARMVAMEEAKERAEKTLKECQTLFHRVKREAITLDLLGVLFAAEVMETEAGVKAMTI